MDGFMSVKEAAQKWNLHTGKDTAFARYMKDATFIVPTAHMLVKVVDALDSLDLVN